MWGPQCTLPLATPVRSEHLLELLGWRAGEKKGLTGETWQLLEQSQADDFFGD